MEAFGIIGMSLVTIGFIFALNAMDKVSKLEKQLQEKDYWTKRTLKLKADQGRLSGNTQTVSDQRLS